MLPENTKESLTDPNSDQATKSVLFIFAILVMCGIFVSCTYTTEDEQLFLWTFICPVITLLLGGYTFTYTGKAHVGGRILFYVFLVLSAISIFLIWYLIELSHAYSH